MDKQCEREERQQTARKERASIEPALKWNEQSSEPEAVDDKDQYTRL